MHQQDREVGFYSTLSILIKDIHTEPPLSYTEPQQGTDLSNCRSASRDSKPQRETGVKADVVFEFGGQEATFTGKSVSEVHKLTLREMTNSFDPFVYINILCVRPPDII